jgi:hypothetical protein
MPTTTHYDRELSTLNDLEISFPAVCQDLSHLFCG